MLGQGFRNRWKASFHSRTVSVSYPPGKNSGSARPGSRRTEWFTAAVFDTDLALAALHHGLFAWLFENVAPTVTGPAIPIGNAQPITTQSTGISLAWSKIAAPNAPP
jgi:hypothetical protein